jgi:hypothetical protein
MRIRAIGLVIAIVVALIASVPAQAKSTGINGRMKFGSLRGAGS